MSAPKSSSGVGYKKPPTHTQFKKGVSGNKGGRPKGSKNVHALLRKEGARPVTLKIGDKVTKIARRDAMIRQLYDKALKGDLAALRLILMLEASDPTANLPPPAPETQLTDAERHAMQALIDKLGGGDEGG